MLVPLLVWGGMFAERQHLTSIYEAAAGDNLARLTRATHDLAEYRFWNPVEHLTSERYIAGIERRLEVARHRVANQLLADVQACLKGEDDDWDRAARDCRFFTKLTHGQGAAEVQIALNALEEYVYKDLLLSPIQSHQISAPREAALLCDRYLRAFQRSKYRETVRENRDQFRRQADYLACQAIVQFQRENPEDLDGLVSRLRDYDREYPRGHFRQPARHFMSWANGLRSYRPYTIQLEEIDLDRDHISTGAGDGAPEVYVRLECGRRSTRSETLPAGYQIRGEFRFDQGVRWRRGEPIRIEVWDADTLQDDLLFEIRFRGELALGQLNGIVEHRSYGHRLRFQTTLRTPELPPVPEASPVAWHSARTSR
ncbi:MAG: hypothetical protein RL885_12810 [Planctomycetota bacterium]